MSFRSIMGSIGNAFKAGWNNGNLQKGMAITGMTAFSVGVTGNMINSMKNDSIFKNCHCNSNGMNMFGGMNMMNMGSCSGMNMFSGMNMLNSMGGMNMMNGMGYNPQYTQMGNMLAFQYGQQLGFQALQNQQFGNFGNLNNSPNYSSYFSSYPSTISNLQPLRLFNKLNYQHETASEISDSVTTDKGESFDQATDEMAEYDINDKNAKSIEVASFKDDDNKKDDYLNSLKATAQSYIKYLSDGEQTVSEYTFVENAVARAIKQNSNIDRNQAKITATNYFRQMDLDGNGEIDWQEMASTISSMDAGGKSNGKKDGKISKDEYANALTVIKNGQFGAVNWTTYRKLFGDD